MGPGRSLSQASVKLGKSLRMFKKWSTVHGWVQRAEAYDTYMEQHSREVVERKLEDVNKAHLYMAKSARESVMVPLSALLRRIEKVNAEGDFSSEEFQDIPVEKLINIARPYVKLALDVIKLERLLYGLPTETIKTEGTIGHEASHDIRVVNEYIEFTSGGGAFKDCQGLKKNNTLEKTESLSKYLVGRAKDSLLTFTELTYAKYNANWHHKLIVERLEAVARGDIKRLMILVPPRYGKSELSSVRFPAWYLGNNPERKVILASYNDRFALHFGKHARNLCQSEMHSTVFPEACVRKDSSSGSLWELQKGGKFVAVGRGGSVTGHGANVLILDDLIKNIQEAYSENVRDTVWDWFKTTLYTRIEEDGAIVIVNTRWHTDDLVGRILNQEAGKWTVLKLPAIADGDYRYGGHVYREGETLWPEKFSLENVIETKEVLGSHFSSIYQQQPEERHGNIIKRDYWKKYHTAPGKVLWTIQSWDTGFKTGEENSYSACTTWYETEEGYYMAHAWWDRVSFPDLKKAAVMLYEKFGPDEVLIEDKASGQSLIQELSISTKIPVKPVKPTGDKTARAHAVTPLFEAGKVYISSGEEWTGEVIDCAASFPRTKNTDVVDSATQALEYLRHGRRFRYSYHGGAFSRESGSKSIFQLEKENKNAGR